MSKTGAAAGGSDARPRSLTPRRAPRSPKMSGRATGVTPLRHVTSRRHITAPDIP